jgi:(p)ppGpp synthase/HD superfamily hydrolase
MEINHKTKRLFEFVKECHGEQVRKYTGEPYWNHLWRVAEIVYSVNKTDWVICVAMCHDLFEDTNCSKELLEAKLKEFGFSGLGARFIVKGVEHLTDKFTKESFPDLNRATRKELEANRLWAIPEFAQTIKYADLIDNTESITQHDPEFSKVYMAEKKFILSNMRDGNKILLKRVESLIN